MGLLRSGKLRYLYLLALAQLVGGPLVLLQVTLLCKLTLREAPRAGFMTAAATAWHSDDFQAALAGADLQHHEGKKLPSGKDGPDAKPDKMKQSLLPWTGGRSGIFAAASRSESPDCERPWNPAWPQAPPGPPPRLA